jgi:hypothetical protein
MSLVLVPEEVPSFTITFPRFNAVSSLPVTYPAVTSTFT